MDHENAQLRVQICVGLSYGGSCRVENSKNLVGWKFIRLFKLVHVIQVNQLPLDIV